jgi:recombination protein RecR
MLPTPITNLIQSISALPGIGKKGSTKIVLDYLNSSKETQDNILKSFIDTRQLVTKCQTCFYISENNQECNICTDTTRIQNQLMIVKNAFDVIPIENNGFYKGKYHILEKLISPLDKQMPSDTTLYQLEHRIEKYLQENTNNIELIYFINYSFSSMTTYTYIEEYIKNSKYKDRITLSQLATGLPTNFNIQSIDQDSLKIAYDNRQ